MNTMSYGQSHDENLKLAIALARTFQMLKRHESTSVRDAGITVGQFGVLEALYHKGDMRVCEVMEKTLSTAGNTTVVIANLVRDGLVRRCQDPEDKRAAVLSITQEGRELIASMWPHHLKNLESAFGTLELLEKKELRALLKKIQGIA